MAENARLEALLRGISAIGEHPEEVRYVSLHTGTNAAVVESKEDPWKREPSSLQDLVQWAEPGVTEREKDALRQRTVPPSNRTHYGYADLPPPDTFGEQAKQCLSCGGVIMDPAVHTDVCPGVDRT